MEILFLGGFGTDAPGVYIVNGKVHRWPGWNPESVVQLNAALNVLKYAAHLKEPGLSETIIQAAATFAQKEIGAHVKAGGVIVL